MKKYLIILGFILLIIGALFEAGLFVPGICYRGLIFPAFIVGVLWM